MSAPDEVTAASIGAPSGTPPVVDQLLTRRLEQRRIVRSHVRRAELVDRGDRWIELRTVDRITRRHTQVPPGSQIPVDAPRDGEAAEGRIRIEVLEAGTFRIRYAPGDAVPDGSTPMVLEQPHLPAPPDQVEIREVGSGIELRTTEATVTVGLAPFTLTAAAPDGRVLCEVGGRERNLWSLWDAYNTGVSWTVPEGRPLATETFALRPGEAVYGFGETFIGLDKVGQTIDVNMVEATGTTTPRSYKNVPFFCSTHGYGAFFDHGARLTAWVGSRAAADVQVAVEDGHLDWYLYLGDLPDVLHRHTAITGRGRVPPLWSFGWWQSKISYRSADEVRDVIDRLDAVGVPVDVVHLDTHWFRQDWFCDLEFDPARFPDPVGFMAELRQRGVRVSLWQLPYIPEGSALFDELEAAAGFVRHPDGGTYDIGICYTPGFRGRVGCIDVTNPLAVEIYQRHLRRLLEAGASVIKVDFGEQAPLDGVYHDGTPGHRAHNLYPLLYNRAVAEVTEAVTGDRIIWARSATAGSQRYPLHWGGDSSANWPNLVPQLHGGLSLGLSGFQFWSQDIGGFLGQERGDLLVRWVQMGVLLSHARIHGAGPRELDAFGEDVLRICRSAIRLRYRLLPYLVASAVDAVARSVPMARPLVVDHQDDPTTWRIGDQFLLGGDLLVAPVADPTGRRRTYLPAGTWTDWWTGERVTGPRWLDQQVPLEVVPLWVREGAVVPLGPDLDRTRLPHPGEVTLRVAPFEGAGTTTAVVPTTDGDLRVVYDSDGQGRHRLVVTDPAAPGATAVVAGGATQRDHGQGTPAVEVLGVDPPIVEQHRGAP